MGSARLRVLFSLATFATVGLPAASVHAAHVLVVADADADTNLIQALVSDGHDVVPITGDFANGNPTLRGDLSPYDLVVWCANGNTYGDAHSDAAMFDNLLAYVGAGGRVLVTGYDTVASPADPLLIAFLGGTGSTDVPPLPGAVISEINSLTAGVIDIRGVTPIPTSGDRDTITGLMPGTLEVVGTSNGGGGAQWTLRQLGAGEIAYVSNGDPGASSASWVITSSDGSGAYNAAVRNFAAAASNGLHGHAHGDRALSPRRAHTLSLADAPSPAVLVGPDRAWIPPGVAVPLSVCGPSCHPVVTTRECAPPECPGSGTLLITSEPIADVGELPHDRDGWMRERMALMSDAELASIAWAFGTHPQPPPAPPQPVRFLRGGSHLAIDPEIHLEGALGVLVSSGVPVGTLSASIGLRFQPPDIDEPLDVMYGNVHGVEARATLVPGFDGQRPEDMLVLVGIAPSFGYAFANDRIRIPSAFAFLLPELGAAVSTSRPLTYYFAWHLEAAGLLDEHVGLDVRADLVVLADWFAGQGAETLLTIGGGVFFR
jgi:hypothetical protein